MPEVCWKTGAYCILNRVNGKVYVGGAYVSLQKRIREHRTSLKNNKHLNRHLQASWNKYGSKSFTFRVLERCSVSDVQECEQKWIDLYDSANREKGYNRSPTAGSNLGLRLTEAQKEKKSEVMRNSEVAKNQRKKLAQLNLGRKLSEATRAKMSAAQKGRTFSDDSKQKMSKSHTGMKYGAQMRAKVSASLIGNTRGRGLRGISHGAERIAIQPNAMIGNQNGRKGVGKEKHFLTDDERRKIKSLYSTRQVSLTELSKIFGPCVSTISKVVREGR